MVACPDSDEPPTTTIYAARGHRLRVRQQSLCGSCTKDMHPTVNQIATPFWAISEYDTALFKVCVALDTAVQIKAGVSETGTKLMRTAFSPNKPLLTIPPRFGNQQGFMDLFAGVMDAIRNPRAHHDQAQFPHKEALEWLMFLSALFRVLDATT